MLQNLEVEYYGAPTQLQSLASISAPNAETLLVNVFDKNSLDVVEKAISSSNLGFNPNNDGKVIRINIPQLTEDRRKEMVKVRCSAARRLVTAIPISSVQVTRSTCQLIISDVIAMDLAALPTARSDASSSCRSQRRS